MINPEIYFKILNSDCIDISKYNVILNNNKINYITWDNFDDSMHLWINEINDKEKHEYFAERREFDVIIEILEKIINE